MFQLLPYPSEKQPKVLTENPWPAPCQFFGHYPDGYWLHPQTLAALAEPDYIYTNYREHGYILARGVAAGPVMAELFGRETGVSGGRGGSMHLFDAESGARLGG